MVIRTPEELEKVLRDKILLAQKIQGFISAKGWHDNIIDDVGIDLIDALYIIEMVDDATDRCI